MGFVWLGDLSDTDWEPILRTYVCANLDVYPLRKDERRNYRADTTTTRQVEIDLKGKCWQLGLLITVPRLIRSQVL